MSTAKFAFHKKGAVSKRIFRAYIPSYRSVISMHCRGRRPRRPAYNVANSPKCALKTKHFTAGSSWAPTPTTNIEQPDKSEFERKKGCCLMHFETAPFYEVLRRYPFWSIWIPKRDRPQDACPISSAIISDCRLFLFSARAARYRIATVTAITLIRLMLIKL